MSYLTTSRKLTHAAPATKSADVLKDGEGKGLYPRPIAVPPPVIMFPVSSLPAT